MNICCTFLTLYCIKTAQIDLEHIFIQLICLRADECTLKPIKKYEAV